MGLELRIVGDDQRGLNPPQDLKAMLERPQGVEHGRDGAEADDSREEAGGVDGTREGDGDDWHAACLGGGGAARDRLGGTEQGLDAGPDGRARAGEVAVAESLAVTGKRGARG